MQPNPGFKFFCFLFFPLIQPDGGPNPAVCCVFILCLSVVCRDEKSEMQWADLSGSCYSYTFWWISLDCSNIRLAEKLVGVFPKV